jgi:flagellar biosynthesis protein
MTDRPKRDTAVALSYRPDQGDEAPRVVASGKGELARRILDLAFAAGVKVREDADLVEILAAVDVDSQVPLEALMAVAEILTYVYIANGRMAEMVTP